MKMYRQGDLLLKECPLPPDAKDITPQGTIVLAKGSVSAHEHVLDSRFARIFASGEKQFLRLALAQEVTVTGTPARHAPIDLPPGEYEVKLQKEYTPEAWRDVND